MKKVLFFIAVFVMAINISAFAEQANPKETPGTPTHIDWIKKGGSSGPIKRSIARIAVSAVYCNNAIIFAFEEDLGAATVEIFCPDGTIVADMIDTAEGTATVTLDEEQAGEYTIILTTDNSVYEGYFAL